MTFIFQVKSHELLYFFNAVAYTSFVISPENYIKMFKITAYIQLYYEILFFYVAMLVLVNFLSFFFIIHREFGFNIIF